MSAALIAAGVSCDGPAHNRRAWAVDGERRLRVADALPADVAWALSVAPIPGTGRVLACDAHRFTAVLANGEAWRLDLRNAMWRPSTPAAEMEDGMKAKQIGPALIAGGSACNSAVWVCDRERRLWLVSAAGRTAIAEAPLPGSALPLACDVATLTVVLDDDSRIGFLGGRWQRLNPGSVRCRVTSSFCYGPPHGDVLEGQVLELAESEARPLMARGWLALAAE